MSENQLYNQLSEIMAERKRLWDLPRTQGGSRETDISQLICPLVSEATLDEMYADPEAAKFMEYMYFETSQVYPDNSKRWTIKKSIGFGSQYLDIVISGASKCEATYRHIS